jgi:hypothetical protein
MLVDQEDGDILSFGVILECRFNHVRLCLYFIRPHTQIDRVGHTRVNDQEVLLLLIIDMSNPSQ